MTNESDRSGGMNWKLILFGGALAAALFLCAALSGFVIGRATTDAKTVTETVSEWVEVEVTRVVEVTAGGDASEPAGGSQVEPEAPTAEPTKAPLVIPPAQIGGQDDEQFALFNEVWGLIERNYDGPMPDEKELIYAAIAGSIRSLEDVNTRFITPDVAARMREDSTGSVSGIGAFVRETDDGYFEIAAPIDGQPADLVGLLSGDFIVAVDGVSVIGVSFDEVILMVRGEEGTQVTLSIAREGEDEPLEFVITRARFEVPVIETAMLADGDVGYIRLLEFNRSAGQLVEDAVAELMAQNPKGLVLDLRNDPGGFLDQCALVGDIFLPEGVLLYERNKNGLDNTFYTYDGDQAEEIPLVVLINGGSASASEIVAGAIQDRQRGILIGEVSFGKGSVQNINPLSDGSELRVTIARWFTPNDNSIDKEGITPDIVLEMAPDVDFGSDDDIQLNRAVDYLLNGE